MSTPARQFSKLSVLSRTRSWSSQPGEMQFDSTTLEERKTIARDIIQSFITDTLPSKFRPEEYVRITEEQGRRPPSEWSMPDDFEVTFMQWGCHDAPAWAVLSKLRTSDNRALAFGQKLRRCFDEQFEEYDALGDSAECQSSTALNTQVTQICHRCWDIVDDAAADVATRVDGQYDASTVLLGALLTICRRDDDLASARPRARSTIDDFGGALAPIPTLYRGLIGDASRHFMLDALDLVQDKWPESLTTTEAQDTMASIHRLLREKGAPKGYRKRFQAFLTGYTALSDLVVYDRGPDQCLMGMLAYLVHG